MEPWQPADWTVLALLAAVLAVIGRYVYTQMQKGEDARKVSEEFIRKLVDSADRIREQQMQKWAELASNSADVMAKNISIMERLAQSLDAHERTQEVRHREVIERLTYLGDMQV